jgi:hypothetical protein
MERVGHSHRFCFGDIMSKMTDRFRAVYDCGFAEGYSGERKDPSRFEDNEFVHYNSGYQDGVNHFDKVMEIMEVTGKSLREVHQYSIDFLYNKIKRKLENQL